MIKKNTLESVIKNYIFDVSGIEVGINDDILEMGLLQSMDFIMLINFITKFANVDLSTDILNKDNFRNISTIISLIDCKINMQAR